MNFNNVKKYKEDIKDKFRTFANLPEDRKIVLVNGNAFYAAEVLLNSYYHTTFSCQAERHPSISIIKQLAKSHGKSKGNTTKTLYLVQYEEMISKLVNSNTQDPHRLKLVYSDVGFPYYPPMTAVAWVTSFGFLSCYGLSAIVITPFIYNRKNSIYRASDNCNLFNIKSLYNDEDNPLSKINPDIKKLHEAMEDFDIDDYKSKIDYRRELLDKVLFDVSIGDGPVYTIKKGILSQDIIKKWDILESNYGVHLYLYEWNNFMYDDFCEEIEEVING